MSAESEIGKAEVAALIESVKSGWEALDIPPRIKRLARALCERDRGNPDSVVMGAAHYALAVDGMSKKLPLVQFPIQPLWVHYLADARSAVEIVEAIPESGVGKFDALGKRDTLLEETGNWVHASQIVARYGWDAWDNMPSRFKAEIDKSHYASRAAVLDCLWLLPRDAPERMTLPPYRDPPTALVDLMDTIRQAAGAF